MSKNSRNVVIEAVENRLFFDVSLLTTTVESSTLPTAVSDHLPLHGTVTVTVANNSGANVERAQVGIGIFISDGPLDVPSGQYGSLGAKLTTLTLLNGQTKTFVIQIHLAKGKLNDGVDTLTGAVAEAGGGFSQSASAGTLTVHPPIVQLSETETFLKLADTAEQGGKFHVTDKVAITNSGTDPSTDPITIGIYATTDDTPTDGALMTSITRKVNIPAGKTVTVPVNIAAIPALAVGNYKLMTQVTETDGTITTTDPSTAPVINVTMPTTGPQFSDSIISNTEMFTPENPDMSQEYLSNLTLKMGIVNSGTTADQALFTLFASFSPTFDPSSALQVGQVTLDPLVIAHSTRARDFFVSFNLNRDLNDGSGNEVDMYIYVQVTDPTGNVTMASFPTPIKVGGPNDG